MRDSFNKAFCFLLVLITTETDDVFCQDPQLSQPWSLSSTLNPALYGGFNDDMKVGLGFSGQSSDLGKVNHQYAYIDTKFEKRQNSKGRKLGLGASYYQYNNASSQIISPLNAGFYALGASYHSGISSNGFHSLSIGSQIGYANGKANQQGAEYDPEINGGGFKWSNIESTGGNTDIARYLDLNAGINYRYDDGKMIIESGLSAFHVLRPGKSVFNNDNIAPINRRVVFHNKLNLHLSAKKRIEFSNILWLQGKSDVFVSSFNQFGVLLKNSYRPVNRFYIDYGLFTRSLKTLMPYILASTGTGLDIRLSHEFPFVTNAKYSVKRTELSLCYTIPGKNSIRFSDASKKKDVVPKTIKSKEKKNKTNIKEKNTEAGQLPVPSLDRDNDGINDLQDKCPTEFGVIENGGCPRDISLFPAQDYLNSDDYYQTIFDNGLEKKDTILFYVFFDKNSTTLLSKSFQLLNGVVYFMKDNPQYSCILSGHADGEGDDGLNMSMSKYRADAVKKYLLSYNIQEARMSSYFYGRKNPMSIKDDPSRWVNRRVEVVLIKNR